MVVVEGAAASAGHVPAYAGRASARAPAAGTFEEHEAPAMVAAALGSSEGESDASAASVAEAASRAPVVPESTPDEPGPAPGNALVPGEVGSPVGPVSP
jgi:hypothetical protein